MLSILIPVKDYDCHLLIEELDRQGQSLGAPYEILIGEDGTSTANLTLNSIADTLPNCRRIVKKENIGRSRIRNILAKEASYPNIIFLDCDAIAEESSFLATYKQALISSDVVCGGLYHANKQPDKNCSLRYKYEKKADKMRDAATRSKTPYDKFTTFNFAIKKELFLSILFDETITRYGYEDALFGKELEKRGINILHIDNKLLHSGLEDNATYLAKTEQALRTLSQIKEKIGKTPLITTANKLRRFHLEGVFMIYWKLYRKCLIKNLLGQNPSLNKFNIYKLGYYITLLREINR